MLPAPEGLCHNPACRQPIVVSPRYHNTDYCVSCTIDREIARRKKLEAKPKKCKHCRKEFIPEFPREPFCTKLCRKEFFQATKVGAIRRRNERRARRKLTKHDMAAYPKTGFQAKRKQMILQERKCGVTGMTNEEHKKKYKKSLHLDHIIPARIVFSHGVDPHDERNLMWLCQDLHGWKKAAEEQLKGKGGNYGFVQLLREKNWPTERLIEALKYSKIYSENLPF
jgi:hypothetical protein